MTGSHVTGVRGNVANLADLDRLYAAVKQPKARIDMLFANAGGGSDGDALKAARPCLANEMSSDAGKRRQSKMLCAHLATG